MSIDIKNYDNNNVFAKILRKELPSSVVLETKHSYAFKDINPVAPIHILVISKGPFTCFTDFINNASQEEKLDFFETINEVTKTLKIDEYRIVSNVGGQAGQEVPHFHIHIISGSKLHSKC